MAQILGLPKLSPTMEEGVLVRWVKKEGDKVSPGDLIAEVETDKANMDFNVEDEGVLLKLLVKEGDTVKLGAPVAIIGKQGEDVAKLLEEAKQQGAAPAQAAAKADAAPAEEQPERPAAAAAAESRKRAAPAGDRTRPAPTTKPPAAGAEDDGAPKRSPVPRAERGVEDSANAPAARRAPREATKPEQRAERPQAGAAAAQTARAAQSDPGGGTRTGRLLASPLAKSLAIELGIDLRTIEGSGPGGRIVERDVRDAADGNGRAGNGHADDMQTIDRERTSDDHATDDDVTDTKTTQAIAVRHARQMVPDTDVEHEDVPASNMRKRIAARLTEAKRDVPHFYLMRQLDAAPLLGFRGRLNELLGDRGKVSVNDLIIKAVALALRRVPECNASWTGDAIRHFHRVHIGVAVAIDDGLVTPVVRDADQKGIGAIAAEVRDLADRAKNRRLKAHEITGSTFTVSNLGMYGIERFTAIINPPEGGILAVGTVVDTPVVDAKGQIVPGKRMTVTMSCDHRVIDGALGARWLQAFGELFEKPESLAL